MTDAIRPLIAGNWKMNGLKSSLAEFEAMLAGASDVAAKADLLVCPPATLIADFAERARGARRLRSARRIATPSHRAPIPAISRPKCWRTPVRAPSSSAIPSGAPITARPTSMVRQKAEAAWRGGLTAIVCIGETQHQRDQGQTLDICRGQLNVSLPDGATRRQSGGGL